MNYSHFDLSEKGIIRRVGIIAFASVIGEAIAYPFDRLKVREIARQTFKTKSIFKETKVIYEDIIKAEKYFGVFYGFRAGIDRILSQNLVRFLVFDFLVGRPLQPYSQISDFQLYVSAIAAQSMSFLIQQPSNILKIKIQCEPLGMDYTKYESYSEKYLKISQYHKGKSTIFMGTGARSGLILQNSIAVSEIFIFFKVLRYFYEETEIKSDGFKVCTSALLTSLITTFITHPLDFIHHRYCIRTLQASEIPSINKYIQQLIKEDMGIFTLYKGMVPSLIRNSIFTLTTFALWNYFTTVRRHEALYNYYSRKYEETLMKSDSHQSYEMTGGRKNVRD
ncbi:hypothetical protein ABPG72_016922 [Tetrahymena utriculariae]